MRLGRRQIVGGAAVLGAAGLVGGAGTAPVPGRLMGASAALGHRLRTGGFPAPAAHARARVVIVGAGIAGLSAAWWLERHGISDIVLLELENQAGGNAQGGANPVSAYPWGAHYVPLLTKEARFARLLFEDLGIITGRTAAGLPVYNEYFLCADPRERLFIQGRWQEDLVPDIAVTADDRAQYRSFFAAMEQFRGARGTDGRKAFAIPIDESSADPAFRALDQLSMAAYMDRHGWNSTPLRWYIRYCCRDDYGTEPGDVSAWAGVHYFAARDGRGGDDDTASVLTWPQGNHYIVQQMTARLSARIETGHLVTAIRPAAHGATIASYDPARDAVTEWQADAVVLAVPHFVAGRLLARSPDAAHSYAPWMVANITLDALPENGRGGHGAPLAWDNVVYDSPLLGYVVATHQRLERAPRQTVLTYYWPLSDQAPEDARRIALARPLAEWQAIVLAELLRLHPGLEGQVRSVDVWLWGHGMIRPTPGYIWGPARAASCVQTPPLFFAHSDMSGISIFEEANYRGVMAAEAVLGHLRGDG